MACVTRSLRTSSSQPPGEKGSRKVIRRPAYRLVSTLDTAAMWYGGTQSKVASSASALPNSTVPMT